MPASNLQEGSSQELPSLHFLKENKVSHKSQTHKSAKVLGSSCSTCTHLLKRDFRARGLSKVGFARGLSKRVELERLGRSLVCAHARFASALFPLAATIGPTQR